METINQARAYRTRKDGEILYYAEIPSGKSWRRYRIPQEQYDNAHKYGMIKDERIYETTT